MTLGAVTRHCDAVVLRRDEERGKAGPVGLVEMKATPQIYWILLAAEGDIVIRDELGSHLMNGVAPRHPGRTLDREAAQAGIAG